MATASYTANTKLNAGKQRRLGQQPGERSTSPRPAESRNETLLLVAECPKPTVRDVPRRNQRKPVNTPPVIYAYAFTSGTYVHYKPAHIGKVKRILQGVVWIEGEKGHFLAKDVTPLRPDPDICPSCLGTGDCGDTRVDSLNNLKDYPCPSCGGTGKRK